MKNVKLNEIIEKKDNSFYIIAETAFAHEGSIDYLRKQIDAAVKGQVDAIKFQILIDYRSAYSEDHSNYEKIEELCFSSQRWREIITEAKRTDLEIILLPIDLKSVEFALDNQNIVDAIEIHSICFNEVPFIQKVSKINKPLILGIGGRTSEDIKFTLNLLEKNHIFPQRNDIMMYGFQSFPTDATKLNLSKLSRIRDEFQPIMGYADHTRFDNYKFGNEVIKYAFLYGARVFEKHLVLERGEKRADYESAISHKEFIELREELNYFIKILGDQDITKLNDAEYSYREREKSLIAIRDLKKDTKLSEDDIGYKVTKQKSDFQQKDFKSLLNKAINKPMKKDEAFKFTHFS